ncbi:MAG TPA: hypothetical protein VKD26_05915 [Streptosporangiaceae bacterium]|nr:hypothetical protein [Streptosporangiaceae bacterium]
MNGGATRRSVLAASLTAPLLAAAGCGAPAAATPPAGRPSDVTILREAIAAKNNLIGLYTAVRAVHPELASQLDPLLTDNTAHLAELNRRLIEPAHPPSPPTGRARGRSPSPAPVPGSRSAALATLRTAERSAAAAAVGQLRTVTPSLAQLLASIAACEAAHAAALAAPPAERRIR